MKRCNKCGIKKELLEFNKSKLYSDGCRTECRECQKIQSSIYREKNKEKINESQKIQYQLNPQIQKERSLKWKLNNPENYKLSNSNRSKKWEEKNKEYRKKNKNNYSTQRLKNDPLFKLSRNIRIRINEFIKNKSKSTELIVGLPFIELKLFLEQKFIHGMSWDNYGDWHIDHKKPICKFDKESKISTINSLSNLQPLWASENLSKGGKFF